MTSSFVRKFRHARGGTAAIEFCFIAPVLLMLYAGITEFGAIMKAYYQTNRLASQYAMAWSDCSDYSTPDCGGELAYYTTTSAFANIAPALDPSQVTLQMFQFQMSGTTPMVRKAYPTGTALTTAQTTAIQLVGVPDKEFGVLVSVSYQHTMTFFTSLMSPYLSTRLNPSYTVVQMK